MAKYNCAEIAEMMLAHTRARRSLEEIERDVGKAYRIQDRELCKSTLEELKARRAEWIRYYESAVPEEVRESLKSRDLGLA